MNHPSTTVYYVEDAVKSAALYAELFNATLIPSSENFACVKLDSGMMLGFWASDEAEPKPQSGPGSMEIVANVDDEAHVNELHQQWQQRGLAILQTPSKQDFGYSFVATCPDGHRIRVAKLSK